MVHVLEPILVIIMVLDFGIINEQLQKLVDYLYQNPSDNYDGTFIAVVDTNALKITLIEGYEQLPPQLRDYGLVRKIFGDNIYPLYSQSLPLSLPLSTDLELQNYKDSTIGDKTYLEWYNRGLTSSPEHDGAQVYIPTEDGKLRLALVSVFFYPPVPVFRSRKPNGNTHGGRYLAAKSTSELPDVLYCGIIETNGNNGQKKYIAYGFNNGEIVFRYPT